MTHYLRMEAVNLSAFIEDTAELSVIRGGGLLLLESVRSVTTKYKKRLEPLATGASTGLFRIIEEGEEAAKGICEEVRNFLMEKPEVCNEPKDFIKKPSKFGHATFVVDIGKEDADFRKTVESLLAKNRWNQWQCPTLSVPEKNDNDAAAVPICDMDRLRAGTENGPKQEDADGKLITRMISPSAWTRYHYGRDRKQAFYAHQMKTYGDWPDFKERFVNDFEALASDPEQGDLHRRMAVIYADGNGFGGIQKKYCINPDTQKDFDAELKVHRGKALKKLLEKMTEDEGYQYPAEKGRELRLETLLWGGDEFIWVVPAWRGWDALDLFYTFSRDWEFKGEPLFHAAGLVFCPYNAPIHGITRLCRDLAEAAKEDRGKSLFQYLATASYDSVGQGLGAFREAQFPGTLKSTPLSLQASEMEEIKKFILDLKKMEFPRRKIHAMARAAVHRAKGMDDEYTRTAKRIVKTAPIDAQNLISSFQNDGILGHYDPSRPYGGWLHIAELWNYIIPDEEV